MAPAGVKPTPTASPTQTPQEKARTARIVMGALSIKSLRASLRDPDSLVIESVWGSRDALYSCIWYRARNGFGGMNRDHVVFSVAGGDQSIRGWNKHCAGLGLDDVTHAATLLGDQSD